jgi:uncharacterized protein (DUF58 family)
VREPHPIVSLAGIWMHGCGLFFLPLVLGICVIGLTDSAEVAETGDIFLLLCFVFIGPPMLLQLVGILLRVVRERSLARQAGLRAGGLLGTVHRHVAIITPRGWGALGTGVIFIIFSLIFKWASLGMLAVFCLVLFYGVLGYASFVSTFLVRAFASGMGRAQSEVERAFQPAVIQTGEATEERFTLRQVPVPSGFNLLIEDRNPMVLQTESRYAIGAGARSREIILSGGLRVTPRGLHRVGPARVYFQDLFGLTRTAVASMATGTLKVLPRFRELEIIAPPKSRKGAPDVITQPHRYATEDFFRFKEYVAGDDTRRIHWRLSVRTGKLILRTPETREITTESVVLLLDSYLPRGQLLKDAVGMGDILDRLVETWISLARELQDKGSQVSLVALADDGSGKLAAEVVEAAAGSRRRWQDLGARVRWQGEMDLPALAAAVGEDAHAVAVSSRFTAPPPEPLPGQSFTWIYLPPQEALTPPVPKGLHVLLQGKLFQYMKAAVRLPAPVGSDENTFMREVLDYLDDSAIYKARNRLYHRAQRLGAGTMAKLVGRGDTVYRLVPGAGRHRLVGVSAGEGSAL